MYYVIFFGVTAIVDEKWVAAINKTLRGNILFISSPKYLCIKVGVILLDIALYHLQKKTWLCLLTGGF